MVDSLVFQLPALAPFRDPQGCFSPGAQRNAQGQQLLLLSQGSGTNKHARKTLSFSKPAHPQNCPAGRRQRSWHAEKQKPLMQLAATTRPRQNSLLCPTYGVPRPLNTGHEVNCQLLCGFSTPLSIKSLLLQVYKNTYKHCSARREFGGVKPHVYTKCFSSFRSYFLLHLALY